MGAACTSCLDVLLGLVTSTRMTSSAVAVWETRLQEQAALVDKYRMMATRGTEKQRRNAYGLYLKQEHIYELMLTNYSTQIIHKRLKTVAPFLKAGVPADMDQYAYVYIHRVGSILTIFFLRVAVIWPTTCMTQATSSCCCS
jgi:hypothetical protein